MNDVKQKRDIIGNITYFFANLKRNVFCNINSLFYYSLILIVVGILFYGYSLVTQCWTTPFGGDYTQEQIQFFYNGYDDWRTFFSTGKFPFWDENTFLGVDNLGSNTFYYITNPFLLFVLLWPRILIPQAMACTSILKVLVAGLGMRAYLKYLGLNEKTSRIFGVCYAVCGWVAFYFWFNTFADVAAFLPFIVLGVEKVIKEQKTIPLIIGVFLESITNYFFLFPVCLFGVGYGIFRFCQTFKDREKNKNLSLVMNGILGFAVGLGISLIAIVPGFLTAMESPRVSTSFFDSFKVYFKKSIDLSLLTNGGFKGPLAYLQKKAAIAYEREDVKLFFDKIVFNWGLFDSGDKEYRKFYPLISFLFPTMSSRFVSLTQINYEWNMGSSLFAYLPVEFMFVLGVFKSIKDRKISHLVGIGIFLIILFVPIFYSLFFFFSSQYGRWEIIAVIALVTYAAITFDKRHEIPKLWFAMASLIVLCLMMVCYGIIRMNIFGEDSGRSYTDKMDYMVIGYIVIWSLETLFMFIWWNKKWLEKILLIFVSVECLIMGTVTQNIQGVMNYKSYVGGGISNSYQETEIVNKLKEYDDSYYRIYSTRAYQGNENIQMIEGYNGVATFHSLYNYHTIDFLRMSHIFKSNNTWIGGVCEKRLNLDTFLGVKYYMMKESETTIAYPKGSVDEQGQVRESQEKRVVEPNVPFGYERIFDDELPEGYRVYENIMHVDLGFTYDTLYNKYASLAAEKSSTIYNSFYDASASGPIKAEETYLKGVILDNSDLNLVIKDYPDFTVKNAPSSYEDAKKLVISTKTYTLLKDNNGKDYGFDPYDLQKLEMHKYAKEGRMNDDKKETKEILVITPSSGETFGNDENGEYFIIDYPLYRNGSTNYNAMIYLYDKDGKLICCDNHTAPGYTNYDKRLRGFYGKNVAKIIISPISKKLYSTNPPIYMEDFATYKERIDTFNEYPLENVIRDINKYSFTTSFDKNRFVVLQLPYEKGWTINAKVDGKKVKLPYYNAQGGFVGFVGLTGDVSYEIKYLSKGLTIAIPLTVVSAIEFGFVIYLETKKKKAPVSTEAQSN